MARADGGFTVFWRSVTGFGSSIVARDFNAAGVAQDGFDTGVGGYPGIATQQDAAVAALSDGRLVVAWTETNAAHGDGASSAVMVQLRYAGSTPVGAPVVVNTTTAGAQTLAAVAGLSGGGFVVVWTDGSATGGDTSSWAIRGQIFAANGTAVGGEFLVNTTTADAQYQPTVTALADGGFVVSWEDYSQNATNSADILARRFDAAGVAIGAEFRVNAFTPGGQLAADSALLSDGRFIVAWQDGSAVGDTSGYGIHLAIADPREGVQVGAARIDVTGAGGVDVVGALEATLSSGTFAAVNGGAFTVTAGASVLTFYGYGVAFSGGAPSAGTVTNFRLVVDGVQVAIGSNMTMDAAALAAAAAAAGGGNSAPLQAILDGFAYVVSGGSGGDVLDGHALGDTFTGGGGGDTIAGAGGDDLAVYAGNWRDYQITAGGGDFNVVDRRVGAPDGADTVSSVERFRFADGTFTLANLLNLAPTDIAFSGASVVDHAAAGTIVAQFTTTDPNALDAFTYALTADPSGYFEIVGNTLRVQAGAVVDIAAGTTRDVTVTVTDAGGLTHTETLAVSVVPPVAQWGGEFTVNSIAAGTQWQSSIAALPDGRFVITFTDNSPGYAYAVGDDIAAATFDASGTRIGPQTVVNAQAYTQVESSVATLADGRLIVTWSDRFGEIATPANQYEIRGRIIDADGTPFGSEFQVNTQVVGRQGNPEVVGLTNGNFFVCWEDWAAGGVEVRAQLYAGDGSPIGGEILVNTATTDVQFQMDCAALPGGGFVVVWTDGSGIGADNSQTAIRGQRFDATGGRAGAEFQVNTAAASGQYDASIASIGGGRFIVAWSDNSLSSDDTSQV
ncbi:MAG: hypothetical protein JNL07_11680, partial [Rhodospirillales bacterium]|nr:hypothetical protein [Rhodospirillales bacterium]